MNDKLIDFLIEKTDAFGEVIKELAKQLGVAAEHVYGVMIKQQYVEGIASLIWSVPLVLVLFGFAIYFFSLDIRDKFSAGNEGAGYAAGTVLAIIGFLFLGFETSVAVMKLLNPEFYAIQEIMELVKGEINND